MQAIPAIDDHGKEGAYRSKMAALCPRLAAGEKSIHDALTNAAAWQQAAAGSVPELPSDLQQNAKRISGCLLYHVCLYAALTLYRNPPTGSSLPAAKAQVQKLADVLGTMETALPEEQRGSLPVASDAIVKEMWSLVCPVQPQTHLPQPTSGEGLQRGWVVLRAHAGTGQGHRRGGGGGIGGPTRGECWGGTGERQGAHADGQAEGEEEARQRRRRRPCRQGAPAQRAWFAELLRPGCSSQAEERRCRRQRWRCWCYLVGELRTSAANPRGWRGLRAAAPRGPHRPSRGCPLLRIRRVAAAGGSVRFARAAGVAGERRTWR